MKDQRLLLTVLTSSLLLAACSSDTGTQTAARTGSNTKSVEDVLNERMAEQSGGVIGTPDPTSTPTPIPSPEVQAEAEETEEEEKPVLSNTEGIDVDLTTLSSTLVYSEVYNMMSVPENYIGKTVKMEGSCSYFRDDSTGNEYYACIIQDATACCAQGIEFIPGNPEAAPADGEDVTVVGVFDTYMEGEYMYCTLRDATVL